MKKHIYFILFLFFLTITSCEKNQTSIYTFDNNNWHFKDSINLIFHISDTSKVYDLSFFFRNTLDYEYRNLYIFVKTNYLDSVIQSDTLQYRVSDKYGKWFGRGLGNTKDNYFLFQKNKKFNKIGQYALQLTHGMRSENLVGCNKFGFKLHEHE